MAYINTGSFENETMPYGRPVWSRVLFLEATTSTTVEPFHDNCAGDSDIILSLRQPKNCVSTHITKDSN